MQRKLAQEKLGELGYLVAWSSNYSRLRTKLFELKGLLWNYRVPSPRRVMALFYFRVRSKIKITYVCSFAWYIWPTCRVAPCIIPWQSVESLLPGRCWATNKRGSLSRWRCGRREQDSMQKRHCLHKKCENDEVIIDGKKQYSHQQQWQHGHHQRHLMWECDIYGSI